MENYITDRTLSDVERVRYLRKIGYQNMTEAERAEWDAPMKGAYNHTDLNRVETAVARISCELGVILSTKTDWKENEIPTMEQMQRYLDNVYAIRLRCRISSSYPMPTRTMTGFNFINANDIEMTLKRCEETLNAVFRCGEIFMGEW